MVSLQRAQTLPEAYRLLDPLRPLEGEWLDRFYAERPEAASIQPLLDELLLDDREDDKTPFTGHRGSGKTTELARLERALASSHIVVRMDVEGLLNLGDVDYADLLVVMGLQVYRQAHRSGARLGQDKLEGLRFWYRTHVLEEDERPVLERTVETELSLGIASITASLRTNTPRRQHVRAEAQANLADLLARLNDLLDELRRKTGKRILTIVDGLDKMFDLGQVRALFLHGANALLEPRCRVVYTVPIALYYTNDFQQVRLSFPRHFALPNIKVWERDGSPCPEGRQALEEALFRRMDPALLTPEAAERLVELSGGLLKELISLARFSVLRARRPRGDRGPVMPDDVEYATRQVRNTYRALLTDEQYRELGRIAQGGEFINSALAQELLHNLSLLEYNGEGAWWAVHPIVRPLLEEWARKHEETG
jgi:hypothetical protein